MSFNTEKRKIFKLWNETENNENIIIDQKNENEFIVDGITDLNRLNSAFPLLINFSSDFIFPSTIIGGNNNDIVVRNGIEFRVTFNNIDDRFIPYIHGEIMYRVGTDGVIPEDDGIPFDENLEEDLTIEKSEIFIKNENSVEYVISLSFDNTNGLPDMEYKLIMYLNNPQYYSDA